MLSEFCPNICPWADIAVALRCLRMGKIYIITDKYVINTSYFPLQQANCARYTQEQKYRLCDRNYRYQLTQN